MSAPTTSLQTSLNSRPEANTTLSGPLLHIFRIVVLAGIALAWICFGNSLMLDSSVNVLMESINVHMAHIYTISLDLLLMVISTGVALVIFWQKSKDGIGLLVALMLVTFGAANTTSINMFNMHEHGQILSSIVMSLGFGTALVFLYAFPDGRFVPSWTRYATVAWVVWFISWPFVPQLSPISENLPVELTFGIFTAAYVSGVWVQRYRRHHIQNAIERQQTKWTTLGIMVAFGGFFLTQLFMYGINPMLERTGNAIPELWLVLPLLSTFTSLAIPITIGISILRFRLWDLDPLIQRVVVYTIATSGLGICFFIEIYVLQSIFRAITGKTSDIALIASTLFTAALFNPVRHKMQNMIDRRFYREKIDFKKTLLDYSHQIRTIIESPQLAHILLTRVTDLLHISYAAVFIRQHGDTSDNSFHLMQQYALPSELCQNVAIPEGIAKGTMKSFTLSVAAYQKLQSGHPIVGMKELPFTLVIPLNAPHAGGTELVGLLAYGPRQSGQAYSSDEQALLLNLADQAGTAMYVAHLIEQQREDAKRRETAERALQAYQESPTGRAEVFLNQLIAKPEKILEELHDLTQQASENAEPAAMLNSLYRIVDDPKSGSIPSIVAGYSSLFKSTHVPELLPVGLRMLTSTLGTEPANTWLGAKEAQALYRLAHEAIRVHTVSQITGLLIGLSEGLAVCFDPGCDAPVVSENGAKLCVPPFLTKLTSAVIDLKGVAEILHAYERVDTAPDKLAYLLSAVEKLSRIDRMARSELDRVDRAIILRIAEVWLGVVSGAMSEIQTRAQIVCRLLTHHTWQDDVVSLSLLVHNDGPSAALNLRISLAPGPDYTAIDPGVKVERLAPDEETQVELRVRPRLPEGMDQFRVRFVVQYADPRGSDQAENFADVVYLLKATAEFQYIPNPYVVGTPLQSGSPLFFGRADVVSFIQENLASGHRHNLVLIGQRRTGKTSLLKQLPRHLGDEYLPVYLDGQSLSLDPGMANFFLNFATEISFAIEDRGLVAPEMPDFTESPAATFERVYLSRVREKIGERHLLILFDEFEELESSVRRGNVDASIFGFLRHLIQHGEKLSMVFCGTHRLEELVSDYWNVLFNISLYRHIGFLEQPETLRLIQEPVAQYGMRYDDLALDKMWRVTAGHPYFLQLLCHSLVNRHNKTQRNYITIADINAALDDILASGEAHFMYLWNEAKPQERLVLAALSRQMLLTGRMTLVQLGDYFHERGITLERQTINDALHHLVLTDILSQSNDNDPAIGEVYRWRLGLLGLWVEKYKSLSRVADEVKNLMTTTTPPLTISLQPAK